MSEEHRPLNLDLASFFMGGVMLGACQLCIICVFYLSEQLFETKDSAHDNRKFSYLLGFLVVAAMEAYLFPGHERSLFLFH